MIEVKTVEAIEKQRLFESWIAFIIIIVFYALLIAGFVRKEYELLIGAAIVLPIVIMAMMKLFYWDTKLYITKMFLRLRVVEVVKEKGGKNV